MDKKRLFLVSMAALLGLAAPWSQAQMQQRTEGDTTYFTGTEAQELEAEAANENAEAAANSPTTATPATELAPALPAEDRASGLSRMPSWALKTTREQELVGKPRLEQRRCEDAQLDLMHAEIQQDLAQGRESGTTTSYYVSKVERMQARVVLECGSAAIPLE